MASQFCAIPMRAIEDERLSAAHWRVLAYVAHRDRMGHGGRHCIEGPSKIAAGIGGGIARETVSRKLADLVRWQYLRRAGGELAVVYAEEERDQTVTAEGEKRDQTVTDASDGRDQLVTESVTSWSRGRDQSVTESVTSSSHIIEKEERKKERREEIINTTTQPIEGQVITFASELREACGVARFSKHWTDANVAKCYEEWRQADPSLTKADILKAVRAYREANPFCEINSVRFIRRILAEHQGRRPDRMSYRERDRALHIRTRDDFLRAAVELDEKLKGGEESVR